MHKIEILTSSFITIEILLWLFSNSSGAAKQQARSHNARLLYKGHERIDDHNNSRI